MPAVQFRESPPFAKTAGWATRPKGNGWLIDCVGQPAFLSPRPVPVNAALAVCRPQRRQRYPSS